MDAAARHTPDIAHRMRKVGDSSRSIGLPSSEWMACRVQGQPINTRVGMPSACIDQTHLEQAGIAS